MSSLTRKDKIGTLSESGGNILLQASILTIGGRQYETTNQISVALPAMTANSRYQVYAVQTAGVVSLVISQNENSTGPVGYAGWKLVGSLFADGVGTFGSFVTITGIPTSGIFNAGPTVVTASTPPTKGTVTRDNVWCKQVGDEMEIRMEYAQTAGGSAGVGAYRYSLPNNEKIDLTRVTAGLIGTDGTDDEWGESNHVGTFSFTELVSADQSGFGPVVVYDEDTIAACFLSISDTPGTVVGVHSATGTPNYANVSVLMQLNFSFKVPIQGWTNTPIEDR